MLAQISTGYPRSPENRPDNVFPDSPQSTEHLFSHFPFMSFNPTLHLCCLLRVMYHLLLQCPLLCQNDGQNKKNYAILVIGLFYKKSEKCFRIYAATLKGDSWIISYMNGSSLYFIFFKPKCLKTVKTRVTVNPTHLCTQRPLFHLKDDLYLYWKTSTSIKQTSPSTPQHC